MNRNFYIREISPKSRNSVIKDVGFDKSYINIAVKKYDFKLLRICDLSCPQAAIIKQLALSAGADAAVHREVITCKVEKTDLMLGATVSQLETICAKLKKQPFKLSELSEQLLNCLIPVMHPWVNKVSVMGILNVTPDSFSDGGKYTDPEKAVEYGMEMIEAGADIIDIGGESTRPYAETVSVREEIRRVIPVIEKLRKLNPDIILSVDTRNSETAKRAIEAGANIINDVSGLDWDENMINVAAQACVPVVIMHSAGPSEAKPDYQENVVDAVYKDLYIKTQKALKAGVKPENIIVDPGIGFGKTIEQNFELTKRINEFKSLGYAVMVGLSRKSFISKTLGITSEKTEEANIALNSYAATNGVNIIRVHDVGKHVRAMKALQKVLS